MASKKTSIKIRVDIFGTDDRISVNTDSDFSRDGTEPNYESEARLFSRMDAILDSLKAQVRRIAEHGPLAGGE